MLRKQILKCAAIILLCATAPVTGWAFQTCTSSQLDTRPSRLPMEGSDPVALRSNVYMAYTTGPKVIFFASNDRGLNFSRQRLDDRMGTSGQMTGWVHPV